MSDWTHESDLRAAREMETELRATVKRLRAERNQAKRLADSAGIDAERALERAEKAELDLRCLQESTVDVKAYDALRAERDRLREALGQIMIEGERCPLQSTAHQMMGIARAALAKEEADADRG